MKSLLLQLFLGTSSSIGGPPMALLLQHQAADHLRANMAAFFVVSCILSLALQAPAGFMSVHHLWLALPLLPAALCGYWLSALWVGRINQRHIRALSLALCLLAGSAAIYSYWG